MEKVKRAVKWQINTKRQGLRTNLLFKQLFTHLFQTKLNYKRENLEMNLENYMNERMISEKYYLRVFYDLLLQVNQLHL